MKIEFSVAFDSDIKIGDGELFSIKQFITFTPTTRGAACVLLTHGV